MAAGHPGDHFRRAKELSYAGLGVCDFDGVYGLAKVYAAYKKSRVDEVRDTTVFYGVELRLEDKRDLPVVLQDTLILYALDHAGYESICGLVTKAHRHGKYHAHLEWDDLAELSPESLRHMVCLLPMRGLLRRGERDAYEKRLGKLSSLFEDRIYQVLTPGLCGYEDLWLHRYLDVARSLGMKILISQDVFFPESKDKMVCDLLHAVRMNQTFDEMTPHMFVNDERCLKSSTELTARFGKYDFFGEAMTNSEQLTRKFRFCLSELTYSYPAELIPSGYDSFSWLEHLTLKKARSFYGGVIPGKVEQLLRKELSLVKQMKFADYFLTVADIVGWARKQGILCQGRGSAANSVICFVLGVTSVDPSLFDVLFERFISVERGDPPDIDVDFEHERREEVIAYIYERYGRDRAAMVANVITFRTRGAVRSVGKALGLSEKILASVSKYLGRYINRGKELTEILKDFTCEYLKDLPSGDSDRLLLEDPAIRHYWPALAKQLKGYPRHLGIHSGGFVISNLPIRSLSPVEPASMEGRTVIQWDKDDIESLGFFKIDVLALGMLTAIRKSFDLLNTHCGVNMSLATVPREDPKTYEMISAADTVGVFQIESRAQMSMLPRLKPRTFYDLVIEVAIIRPGPIQGGLIHPFLKRRDGVEPVIYPHPELRPILQRTLGIPLFQEQVMRIAMAVGGFSPGEADELRRKMGAWQIKGDLSHLLMKLQDGMQRKGIAPHFIAQIMKQLEAFSAYGFPESHAASFAHLAYVSSYLKCHHPAAFFTALLNSQPMGFYSAHTLIQTAKRARVEIRRVCVLFSEVDHTLEPREKRVSEKTSGTGDFFALRLGLRLVRGLSKQGAQRLVEHRQRLKRRGEVWRSMEEFMCGQVLERADLVALAASDAFRSLGIDRRQAIWSAHAAVLSPHFKERETEFEVRREDSKERLDIDFYTTGTSLYLHPTELMKLEYWDYPVPQSKVMDSRRLPTLWNGAKMTVFGLIIARQAPPTANGMLFITLEDQAGFMNLAVRPHVYRKYQQVFDRDIFLLVRGTLVKEGHAHSLTVLEVVSRKPVEAEVTVLKGARSEDNESKQGETSEDGEDKGQWHEGQWYQQQSKKQGGSTGEVVAREASEGASVPNAGKGPRFKTSNRRQGDIPRFTIRNFH